MSLFTANELIAVEKLCTQLLPPVLQAIELFPSEVEHESNSPEGQTATVQGGGQSRTSEGLERDILEDWHNHSSSQRA